MFRGEHTHNIDAKGRIFFPVKFREELGDRFYITKGLDGCLFVFPSKEWEELEAKLSAIPITNQNGRKIARMLQGGAFEAEVDSQGRVLIPQGLREHGDIKKEIVTMGVGRRIEIWGKERLQIYQGSPDDTNSEAAEALAEFGV